MDEQSVNANNKIDYVKPVILDLGAVTAAYGAASCGDGNSATYDCDPNGVRAGVECVYGDGVAT